MVEVVLKINYFYSYKKYKFIVNRTRSDVEISK